jgi:hypothetical protein
MRMCALTTRSLHATPLLLCVHVCVQLTFWACARTLSWHPSGTLAPWSVGARVHYADLQKFTHSQLGPLTSLACVAVPRIFLFVILAGATKQHGTARCCSSHCSYSLCDGTVHAYEQ